MKLLIADMTCTNFEEYIIYSLTLQNATPSSPLSIIVDSLIINSLAEIADEFSYYF